MTPAEQTQALDRAAMNRRAARAQRCDQLFAYAHCVVCAQPIRATAKAAKAAHARAKHVPQGEALETGGAGLNLAFILTDKGATAARERVQAIAGGQP